MKLPGFLSRIMAGMKKNRETEAPAVPAAPVIADTPELRDGLFARALRECMFVDEAGLPAQPLYRVREAAYYPYDPVDNWAKARMDYEANLMAGLPKLKAFKKDIAEYLTPELYYADSDGNLGEFRIFTNAPAAMERYHELLAVNGIRMEGIS